MQLLLQLSHRLTIAAILLILVTFVLAVAQKPADAAAWATLGLADGAILIAAITLVSAYRRARPVRQSLGLLFMSLILIHVSAGLLLTHFSTADRVRSYFSPPSKP